MSNYPSTKPGQGNIKRIVAGILFLNFLALGNGGIGVASEAHSLMQIQKNRITGVLTQVPLRRVLEQLQEQLAIEYVVSEEELNKPISANFAGEPVIKALTKILSPWDYALEVDQQGRVHHIFVVAKAGPIAIEEDEVKASESNMTPFPKKMVGSQPFSETPQSRILLSGTEMASNQETEIAPIAERDTMASPMGLVPSEKLPPMVIQPTQGGPMSIQPASNFMQVIPASGYAPMEILPVSEDARREFIEGHN